MGELTGAVRRLRLGMVGGGRPSGIGEIHRLAARLDGRYELVAGCFSRDPVRGREAARRLMVSPERCYPDWRAMAEGEAVRADRVDVVAVVSGNDTHVPATVEFLARSCDVMCEKPLAVDHAAALSVRAAARRAGRIVALGHYFAGFAMLRQARAMIAEGALGEVRMVQAEHASEGLALGTPDGRAPVGVIADLGVHAAFLVRFVAGASIDRVAVDAARFTPGRPAEDDARVLLRLGGGARGAIWVSHAAGGHRRWIRLRVAGSRGALEWSVGEPDLLRHTPLGEPTRLLQRGGRGLIADAGIVSRLPSGHVEGTIEALATVYGDLADAVATRARVARPLYPDVEDGVAGAAFIESSMRSIERDGAWVDLPRA
ncbi:MAG: Gfo/Idh/MocA family oxidoreductase [Alphaproteobacteria bacterium]|nr:Gfo/Idh/MocA family oxidoreductase [Alphaproteobacteria bacterium]